MNQMRDLGSLVTARSLSLGVATLLLAANLVQGARIVDLYWPDASRVAYAIQLVIPLLFLIVAIKRADVLVAGATVATLLGLVGSNLHFALHTGLPSNISTVATYFPLLSLIVFFELDCPMRQVLRVFLWLCIGYLLLYVTQNAAILASASINVSTVLSAHDGSGGRVYLAASYAMFVGFAALRAKQWHWLVRASLIALVLYAMWLSSSRLFTLLSLVIAILAAFNLMSHPVRIAMLAVVCLVMTAMLAGVVVEGWNPLEYFAWDVSGIYRQNEYVDAISIIRDHWRWGIGTASDFKTLQSYLKTPVYRPLFPADLGVIAPWFEFGLPGLAVFVSVTCVVLGLPMQAREPESEALQLTCVVCALYTVASPLLLFEPSAIFTMILGAMWLRRRTRKKYANSRLWMVLRG